MKKKPLRCLHHDEHPLYYTWYSRESNAECMCYCKDKLLQFSKNNRLGNQRLGNKIENDCINDGSYMSRKCLHCISHNDEKACNNGEYLDHSNSPEALNAINNNHSTTFVNVCTRAFCPTKKC